MLDHQSTHGKVELGLHILLQVVRIQIIKPILLIVGPLQQLMIFRGDPFEVSFEFVLSLRLQTV